MYYWVRDYSSALSEGGYYEDLPRTVIIIIVAFRMFDCAEFESKYQVHESTRHTLLTDKLCLQPDIWHSFTSLALRADIMEAHCHTHKKFFAGSKENGMDNRPAHY